MIVYAVFTEVDYEGSDLEGIFDTKKLAETCKNMLILSKVHPGQFDDVSIVEIELNKLPD